MMAEEKKLKWCSNKKIAEYHRMNFLRITININCEMNFANLQKTAFAFKGKQCNTDKSVSNRLFSNYYSFKLILGTGITIVGFSINQAVNSILCKKLWNSINVCVALFLAKDKWFHYGVIYATFVSYECKTASGITMFQNKEDLVRLRKCTH